MMRILHIADVHFDTSFGCKSARVRDALRTATRRAFSNAVDDAIANAVDAVVIAGDLFDDQRLRLDTERFLVDEFSRLEAARIRVVYATGNHDPSAPGARLARIRMPDNVALLGGATPRVVSVPTSSGDLHIVGAGHESDREMRNLAASFPDVERPGCVIGLLHTNVESASTTGEHHAYAPCTAADLSRDSYSYWALGHIHVPGPIGAEVPAYYAGCIQGRHFRESGPRGGYLVTMDNDLPAEVEFRSYAPIQWHTVDVPLDEGSAGVSPTDVAGLDRLVATAVRQLKSEWTGIDLAVRIALTGGTTLSDELRDPEQRNHLAEAWATELDLLYVEVDASKTHAPIDLESATSEATVLAEALSILDEVLLTRDTDTLRALLPTESLAQDHENLLRYIADNADSLRFELAERMLIQEKG